MCPTSPHHPCARAGMSGQASQRPRFLACSCMRYDLALLFAVDWSSGRNELLVAVMSINVRCTAK